MQKDMPRFELKLRDDVCGSKSENRDGKKTKKSFAAKMTNSSIVCAAALIAVMLLKMSSSVYAGGILSRLDKLISEQTDFTQAAHKVSEVFSQSVSSIFPDKSVDVSAPSARLASPVEKGALTKPFAEETHPIYGTKTAPTCIEISAPAKSFVYAADNGTLTQLVKNGDGSMCAGVVLENGVNVIYDNLFTVYFKQGETVEKNQIIGMLGESEPAVLKLGVIADSAYADPSLYIDMENITQ